MRYASEFIRAYVIAALWSSTGDDGEPLDADHDASDIAPATLADMREECRDFIRANLRTLCASGLGSEQAGHDFWLTRNRHGAGFWDRGIGELGEALTRAAKVYGGRDLYVGDDGLIYQG